MLIMALGTVLLCSVFIKLACDSFESSSYYLGRHVFRMPAGVRGATIEAIGSSMPELLTTFFLLFSFREVGGFAAGIATCAGSAVFNAVVIPALCILAVTMKSRAMPRPLPFVSLDRSTILRDGCFFLGAEMALIVFLGARTLTWWMGGFLLLIYVAYFSFLLWQMRSGRPDDEDAPAELGDDAGPRDNEGGSTWKTWLRRAITLDWQGLIFAGRPFTAGSAWVVLALSVMTLAVACHALAAAVIRSAEALSVPPYFTAVILGAAATSVPDTFISVANALKGDYDDALANAVGSNIFDICVALGLPLMLYGWLYGGIHLEGAAGLSSAAILPLRLALLIVTLAVLFLFLSGKRQGPTVRVGKGRAYVLLLIYLVWNIAIFLQAAPVAWWS